MYVDASPRKKILSQPRLYRDRWCDTSLSTRHRAIACAENNAAKVIMEIDKTGCKQTR